MTPHGDTLTALADCDNARDAICSQMIVDELAPVFEAFSKSEDDAAVRVEDAFKSMAKPERHLAEIDAEIIGLRSKADVLKAMIDNPLTPSEDRIHARGLLPFYEAELTAMAARRDQGQAAVEAAQAELNKAKNVLEQCADGKLATAMAMANPLQSAMAQRTNAFQVFYLPYKMAQIIIVSGDSHPAFYESVETLRTLCRASGYRTDDITAEEAEQMRKAWEVYRQEANSGPETQMSGAEVMRQGFLSAQSLLAQREYVEDLRGVKVPRNMRVADHMKVPETASEVRHDLDAEVRRRLFTRT